MNINISLSSDKYISEIIFFEKNIQQNFNSKFNLRVFIDEVYDENTYNLNYVYSHNINNPCRVLSLESAYEIIDNHTHIIDSNLFKSDLRLSTGHISSKHMILKQASLTSLIFSQVSKNDFLTFSFGGSNIIHSILFKISYINNVFTYRIHNAINLESGFKSNRLWFSPNNIMLLSQDQPLFSHNKLAINKKVNFYIDNLISGIKRDTLSKQFVSRRYPNSVKLVFNEFWKFSFLFLCGNKKYKIYFSRFKLLINSFFVLSLHSNIKTINKPYIFFALNVPTDSQILVRAPYFRDFISLISIISDSIPLNHFLVIREHPAFPGMLNYFELRSLLNKKRNIKLISHKISFINILKNAKSLLIINNTSFLEANLMKIPIISLGKGVFSNQNITNEVIDFGDLSRVFINPSNVASIEDLKLFLSRWYLETYPVDNSDSEKINSKIDLVLNGILEKIKLHLNFVSK
jgi:hypothetical protein